MKSPHSIAQYLFQKDNPEDIPSEKIDELLIKYPYWAHLHWLKAKKHSQDKTLSQQAGLHTYYPGILKYYLECLAKPKQAEEKTKDKLSIKDKIPEKPLIQPLYTKDYFAYTQTKLPEKIENDKPPTLEQVKSFTGWLRMMKNPQTSERQEDKIEETGIDHSEETNEVPKKQVITESMAKIWEQNGRPEEAIRIYKKLILLNPEKRSYFAAKISALKEQ